MIYYFMAVGFSFYHCLFFFFKQKTAYDMRISDWSSDVCSSDLGGGHCANRGRRVDSGGPDRGRPCEYGDGNRRAHRRYYCARAGGRTGEYDDGDGQSGAQPCDGLHDRHGRWSACAGRSEEHTSELQSLMRISYAVFCLKKKIEPQTNTTVTTP